MLCCFPRQVKRKGSEKRWKVWSVLVWGRSDLHLEDKGRQSQRHRRRLHQHRRPRRRRRAASHRANGLLKLFMCALVLLCFVLFVPEQPHLLFFSGARRVSTETTPPPPPVRLGGDEQLLPPVRLEARFSHSAAKQHHLSSIFQMKTYGSHNKSSLRVPGLKVIQPNPSSQQAHLLWLRLTRCLLTQGAGWGM